MIGIVDYGVGNLFSLESSFRYIGQDVVITDDEDNLMGCSGLILPGVGAFRDAIGKLRASDLDKAVLRFAETGKPLMGICLGMQLLMEKSLEYGEYEGLGLIPGTVRPIADVIDKGLKIPQIGWNGLHLTQASPLFKNIRENDQVYFVHSYFADADARYVLATTDYSCPLTAAVGRDNVTGCQFHPEKSGNKGLDILRAFGDMVREESV